MNARPNVQRVYQREPNVIEGGRSAQKKTVKAKKHYYDFTLLFSVIAIFAIGLLMIFSGSQYTAMLESGSSTYYFRKQLFIGGAGLLFAILCSKLDYHILKMGILPLLAYAAAAVMPFLTLILGIATNGKTRWLSIAGVSFQPAELTKVALIVFFAIAIESLDKRINIPKTFVMMLGLGLLPALLIFSQNLSSGFIVAFIVCAMLYVSTRYSKLFLGAGFIGIACFAAAKPLVRLFVAKSGYSSVPSHYWMRRILAWALPEMYTNDAYQTTQGLYAIGSGGLFGRGLGESIQKFGKIPEVQNDMIFTVICEELGFFGATAIILIYAVIIWRIYMVAVNAKDKMGTLLCVGVMAHLGIQVVLNLAVVTGVFPNTGVTLPFISYGGSAILFTMAEIGLVLSVSNQIPIDK